MRYNGTNSKPQEVLINYIVLSDLEDHLMEI